MPRKGYANLSVKKEDKKALEDLKDPGESTINAFSRVLKGYLETGPVTEEKDMSTRPASPGSPAEQGEDLAKKRIAYYKALEDAGYNTPKRQPTRKRSRRGYIKLAVCPSCKQGEEARFTGYGGVRPVCSTCGVSMEWRERTLQP